MEGLRYRLGDRVLLAGVDLAVGPGRSVAVTGPSGSGKSTLLTCVLRLIAPDEGTVAVNGHRLTGLSGRKLAQLRRRHLGVVFQFGELLPELTPVENVALPVLLDGGTTRPRTGAPSNSWPNWACRTTVRRPACSPAANVNAPLSPGP